MPFYAFANYLVVMASTAMRGGGFLEYFKYQECYPQKYDM